MIKKIKKIGGSLVIIIDNEDKDIYELCEGDLVDIEICKLNKKIVKNGRRRKKGI